MSDLPSRDDANAMLAIWDERTRVSSWGRIVQAYASGRFDREAIDREAAILRLPEAVDAEGRYIKTWGEIVDLVLDAAIGDGDKGGSS